MKIERRAFLGGIGSLLASGRASRGAAGLRCDVAVIGGGTGGCAAALAALRNGMSVVLTEETDWLGGQLTSQGVPPDEHPWIEAFGSTRLYRDYRTAVRAYYRRHYPLTEEARLRWNLNPGDGGVSRLTHEPRVSVAVLEAMLAAHRSGGRLTVLGRHRPEAADVAGDAVRSVTLRDLEAGGTRVVAARYVLDATEQGDLLPLTRAEYVVGAESRAETGEPHAPERAQPGNVQAFTWCFAIDHVAGADFTIDRPAEYAFWRDFVPPLRPAWSGRLFSWTDIHPVTLENRTHAFDPECDARGTPGGLWLYRRIARARNFVPGSYAGDVSLVNWPMNDYMLGNLVDVGVDEAARHLARAKQQSLSLLYWLQTEAPRPDGGQGWRGLRLRPDVMGTADGLARYPYIREARRIRAEFTVVEQHVGTDARRLRTGRSVQELTAEPFADSVGVGSYRIDLHPSSGGDNYIDVSSLPFQIPLGALIPARMENLIAAGKCLGVTHITNGCYRLHPVEWNVGESAGMLAAHCVASNTPPRGIRRDAKRLADFQAKVRAQGIETAWPRLEPR